MIYRMFSLGAMAFTLLIGRGPVLAADETRESSHEGKVVKLTSEKLVMTGKAGKEHSHMLTSDAKLTLDGKPCTTEQLVPGTRIRLTSTGSESMAIRIEGIEKNRYFASNRHEGKVVSITKTKLVMSGKDGEEHSHMLTADAQLTLDGRECKPDALVAGTRIRVTTSGSDKTTVSRVEGIDTTKEFVSTCHDGKVVSIDGVNLVLTNAKGQEEHTCTLTPNAKITCDGEVCKASDLKPGMRIRITSHCDDENMAVCIEALDKNEEFKSVN